MLELIGLAEPIMGVRHTVECPSCRAREASYFDCYMGDDNFPLICKTSYACLKCDHRWFTNWHKTKVIVRRSY